jgi:hypothetical protein
MLVGCPLKPAPITLEVCMSRSVTWIVSDQALIALGAGAGAFPAPGT